MIRKQSSRYALRALVPALLTLAYPAHANDPRLGTSRQRLVGGSVVDASVQEEFGLLTYADGSGNCSASLLRNNWAVTAAHCVEVTVVGAAVPDPKRPGQNMVRASPVVTLTASWGGTQVQRAVQIETFRPYDVALIRTAGPFTVHGSSKGYSRLVFQDGQFPYFGDPVGAGLVVFGQGINTFATGEGDSAIPASGDGQYRVSYAKPTRDDDTRYWYPSEGGQMIAGGDSGGPSFAWVLSGYALVGVHSLAHTQRVPGKPTAGWMWVTATPEAADAPLAPVLQQLQRVMGPPPPGPSEPALEPPPPGFVGTFARTPPDYQPLWLYGIRANGELVWYRKDSGAAAWQGPKTVGVGWNGVKDVIAAGGNRLYALTADNKLMWYQHDGFNDGAFRWNPRNAKGGVEVGHGWSFKKIFSGGDGIVYAISETGALTWYRHGGYADGGGEGTWDAPKVISPGRGLSISGRPQGIDWAGFKDVFSTGAGHIYAVKTDGTLWLHTQKNYATGGNDWYAPERIGVGWGNFQQIVPAGNDVILAIKNDGQMLWYRRSIEPKKSSLARTKMRWEGPVPLGTNWQGFGKVIALIPVATLSGPR